MNKQRKAQEEKENTLARETKASKIIQSAVRGRAVRGAVHLYRVESANARGEMLAMPGTTLGQSGWYQQDLLVYKFDVTADGEFVQLNNGIEERVWRRQHLLEQAEEETAKGKAKHLQMAASGTAALQQRREQSEIDRLTESVANMPGLMLPLVIRMQSAARGLLGRMKSRQLALGTANSEGAMLAMPGTEQGGTGWYQAGDLVFR